MNIVFFGSSSFGVPSLKVLIQAGHKVSCVVTQPDRKKGRGLPVSWTSIKATANALRIRSFQPENVNDVSCEKFLKELKADLFVVIAYGQILNNELLAIPALMAINVHASLLPHYRGAAPIQWAIINGDTVSGVSVIKLTRKMDAGPILLSKPITIEQNETVDALEERLSLLGAQALSEIIVQIESATCTLQPQDTQRVSYAPKLKKKDGMIAWEESATQIEQLVRGCGQWPGAYTYYKGTMLKVHTVSVALATVTLPSHVPGEIIEISKQGVSVATGRGVVRIEALQKEGGKLMQAHDFIAGHKMSVKEILGKNSCA